jgi:hypothetical protein
VQSPASELSSQSFPTCGSVSLASYILLECDNYTLSVNTFVKYKVNYFGSASGERVKLAHYPPICLSPCTSHYAPVHNAQRTVHLYIAHYAPGTRALRKNAHTELRPYRYRTSDAKLDPRGWDVQPYANPRV